MIQQGVHNTDWEPGEPGKGIVDDDGGVHTWVDGQDYDFHNDYVNLHGIDARAVFYIRPDGTVHDNDMGGGPVGPDDDLIKAADPRLKVTQTIPGWEF